MRELAMHHGQLGWKSYAFPISVDGLEIVASLYLVAQRRAGRPTGWITWVTLIIGTAASLAANVAVGGAEPIGKALAGWPALSMLVSVKLLFAMFDHGIDDQRTTSRDDQRTAAAVPDVPDTVRPTGQDGAESARTDPRESGKRPPPSATGPEVRLQSTPDAWVEPTRLATDRPGDPAAAPDIRAVAHLVPAARLAAAALAMDSRSLSRDNLADLMRARGHGVSNERASLLLKVLRAEGDVTPIAPSVRPDPAEPQPIADVVA